MDLLHWFRRSNRPVASSAEPRRRSTFRPSLLALEDRVVPAALPIFASVFSAAKVQVTAPANVEIGKPFNVTVTALTGLNRVASTYTGSVQFSLGITDAAATLPANYKFTTTDMGVKTFTVTLGTAASQTIRVFDVANVSLSGTAAVKAAAPAAPTATQFKIQIPSRVVWGQPTAIIVTALDSTGHKASGYTGTVSFASSDAVAYLPPKYTFTSLDQGSQTFLVNLRSLGSQSIMVSDVGTSKIYGLGTTNVALNGPVVKFGVYSVASNMVGGTNAVMVVALDAYGQIVSDYAGTVKFSSSDAKAGLPSQYTFTVLDRGAHLFNATLNTAGIQRLQVTDSSSAAVLGFFDVLVVSAFGTGVKGSAITTQFYFF